MVKKQISKQQMVALMAACGSDGNIAKAVGCSRQCVMRIRHFYSLKRCDVDVRNNMIISLRKDGHSVYEIGKIYKLTERQIYRILKKEITDVRFEN